MLLKMFLPVKKEWKLKQVFGILLINIYVIKIYMEIIVSYWVYNRSCPFTARLP